jgi:hypothetical protein
MERFNMSELKIPEISRKKHNKKMDSPKCGKHPKGAEDYMTKPGGVNWSGSKDLYKGTGGVAAGVAAVAGAALQQGQEEESARQAATKARLDKGKQSILRR